MMGGAHRWRVGLLPDHPPSRLRRFGGLRRRSVLRSAACEGGHWTARRPPLHFRLLLAGVALLALGVGAGAQSFSSPYRILPRDGQAIYEDLCQGCHMPQGQGAVGAGFYPALAHDEKLAAAGYAVSVIAGGRNGMPPMSFMLDDEQIAAVVNYVRTHFGNDYADAVTAADARAARGQ
jgi:mono/diheme cytochrome c family protein